MNYQEQLKEQESRLSAINKIVYGNACKFNILNLDNGEECLVLFNGYEFEILDQYTLVVLMELLEGYIVNYDLVTSELIKDNNQSRIDMELSLINSMNSKFKPKIKSGYIYVVICNRTKLHKIGVTTKSNVTARIKQLSVANPDISLVHYFKVDDIKIEKVIHEEYANKRISGEWFELSENDLESIKTKYI